MIRFCVNSVWKKANAKVLGDISTVFTRQKKKEKREKRQQQKRLINLVYIVEY